MPDLTLTVTTDQWTRIKAAFQVDGEDPTAADMSKWIKRQIKAEVKRKASQAANATADADVQTELADEGWDE